MSLKFHPEPVAFDFNGDILSFSAYNDKLVFLLQLENGHKILRVDLKNPEIIEDFNVIIGEDYCLKMLSNILLLSDKKLYIVDLNIEYDLDSKMSDIVEYRQGYITASQRGHVYYLQGTTVIDSGLINKIRNKSKNILQSTEIGSLPNEKAVSKIIIQPFPDSTVVGFLFVQNRILYQAIWDQQDFTLNDICRDVVDVCTYRSPISKICIATSRSIYLASTDYINYLKTDKWIKLENKSIALDVVKISHCFLTEYYVGIVDDVSKSICFYWIPNPLDQLSEIKISVQGFCHDTLMNTYWVHSNRQLFEIIATNESQGLWRKFVEINDFEKAKELATANEEKDEILYNQAKYLLSRDQGSMAASCFAQMNNFDLDEIALLLTGNSALREFIVMCIPRIHSKISKTLVLHWSLYLALEEMTLLRLQKLKHNHLYLFCKSLLLEHKHICHPKTVYQLLQSHDEDDLILEYADMINDYKHKFYFYINKKDYLRGINTLENQKDVGLIYSNISLLLQHSPKETVNLLLNHPDIDPRLVIPAFVKHLSDLDSILLYLESIIKSNREPSVHNFLFSLYCQYSNEDSKIMPYLLGNRRFCDLDYALLQTTKFNHSLSTVTIYSELGLHDEAIQMSLRLNDLSLAKKAVNQVSDHSENHRLWLKIAKHVVEKNSNLKEILETLDESPLDVYDLLPWFPNFEEIDEFKDEICKSLEKQQKRINKVHENVQKWQHIGERLHAAKLDLRKRYTSITIKDVCSHCRLPLIQNTDYFTVYSCRHGFHFKCMLNFCKTILPSRRSDELSNLQVKLELAEKQKDDELVFAIRKDIESMATFECCYCGEIMIKSIDMPFYAPNDNPLKI
eukprot:NODE_274_length_12130_cov_0.238800.p1 type:complete len:852 gc:universal NODE_274_length_12130_cov_0.238800:3923-6478(+)